MQLGRTLVSTVAAVSLVILLGPVGHAQESHGHITDDQKKYKPVRPETDDTFEVLPVQGDVYMIVTGKGCNIALQVGSQGALLVDASTADVSDRVIAAVKKLTTGPIRAIVDTTTDLDHIGGNETLLKAGQPMYGLSTIGAPLPVPEANVFAHEKALNRISAPTGQVSEVPSAAWPGNTFSGDKKKLSFNHEPIELLYTPGHTDGDLIVFFRRSDVIAAGDVFSTTSYPVFDLARGGSIQGVLDGLNHIVDLAVPEINQQRGTRIIPGHGRIGNQSDVVEYRDMATIVRDRVRDLIKEGKTLDQIKAAGATLDYDGLYSTPSYTGAMFVEAIYKDLTKPAKVAKPAPPKGKPSTTTALKP